MVIAKATLGFYSAADDTIPVWITAGKEKKKQTCLCLKRLREILVGGVIQHVEDLGMWKIWA